MGRIFKSDDLMGIAITRLEGIDRGDYRDEIMDAIHDALTPLRNIHAAIGDGLEMKAPCPRCKTLSITTKGTSTHECASCGQLWRPMGGLLIKGIA